MVYFACRNAASTRRMLAVVLSVSVAVAALMVVLMAELALAGASMGQVATHDVRGTVAVPFGASSEPVSCGLSLDEALLVLGGEASAPCPVGVFGEYSDVEAGSSVMLTDAGGAVLATTALTGGVAEGGTVTFEFAFADVPDADRYGVEVNSRGPVTFDRDVLARRGWLAALDLR